jgi:O-antigen ligase
MGVIFALGTWLFIRLKWMHQAMLIFFALVLSAVLWLSQNNTYLNYKPKFEKTIMHESLEDHIMATIQGTDISSAERYYRWIAAIRMSQDRPITGVGPNNFYDYYKSYTITSFRTWVSRNFERSTTHNYFLFMLVEQGYPAMILYAAMIWSIFFFGQRLYHRLSDKGEKIIVISVICMLASLFINNFFSELLETDKIGSLFLLGIAVLVIFDLKKSPKYPPSGIGVEI